MPPPHAIPAQPTEFGASMDTRTSYGARELAFSGMAIRYAMLSLVINWDMEIFPREASWNLVGEDEARSPNSPDKPDDTVWPKAERAIVNLSAGA